MTAPVLSLGIATDLLAMSGESIAEHHPDRIVQRSPDEPNFWFGNRVVFRTPPQNANAHVAQFRQDFPMAGHICMSWDQPDLSPILVQNVFEDTGLEIDQEDVLVLNGPVARPPQPDGIIFRPLSTDGEWAQSEDLSYDDLVKKDYPKDGMRPHLRQRSNTRRGQIARDLGQWFGAFDGDLLVGDMGVFHDDCLIRYQSVQTRESHRRRGICSALCAMCWIGHRRVHPGPGPSLLRCLTVTLDGCIAGQGLNWRKP